MRRFSKKYILADGEKYYLVSAKEEWGGWSPVAFFKKSKERDEYGFMIDGDSLKCPHPGEVSRLAWVGIDGWVQVQSGCKKCWGSHRTPDSRFNCILSSLQIKQYRNGYPAR